MSPCNWPVSYAGCPEPTWDAEQQETSEAMATELLWNWTSRSYGICEAVVRPCRSDCWGEGHPTYWGRGPYPPGTAMDKSFGAGIWGPVLVGGQWYNLGCGVCGDNCSCGWGAPSLRLPGPIQEVDEVRISGEVLASSAYRVDNYSLLVRIDGERWPLCQNLSAPITEEGSWQISYQRGHPVPVGGQVAAGVLASEMFKATCRDNTCQLPQRLQSITRQGVTVAVLDSFADVALGRTGIWMIDSWLASVMKSPTPSRVYSPDIPRPRQRTTTFPT